MRKLLLFIALVMFLGQTFATTPVELPKPTLNANNIFFPVGKTGQKISLMELARISIKDFELLKGQKMKLFGRLTFKASQKQSSILFHL